MGSSRLRRFSVVCQGNKGDTFRYLPFFHQGAGAVVNTTNHIFVGAFMVCGDSVSD